MSLLLRHCEEEEEENAHICMTGVRSNGELPQGEEHVLPGQGVPSTQAPQGHSVQEGPGVEERSRSVLV